VLVDLKTGKKNLKVDFKTSAFTYPLLTLLQWVPLLAFHWCDDSSVG
jgi:hypothetical protein